MNVMPRFPAAAKPQGDSLIALHLASFCDDRRSIFTVQLLSCFYDSLVLFSGAGRLTRQIMAPAHQQRWENWYPRTPVTNGFAY